METIDNYETIYEDNSSHGANNLANVNDVPVPGAKEDYYKIVGISGTVGVLLGTAATYAATKLIKSDTSSENEEINDNDYVDSESDDLSFGEAWGKARSQLGANGVFEWRGNVYSTATKEEWEENHNLPKMASESTDFTNSNNIHAVINGKNIEDFDNSDIQILGVEEGKIGNHPITVGGAIINGHDAIVVDIDHDGTFDDAVIDKNDNHHIDEGENINIQDKNITVDDFKAQTHPNINHTNSTSSDEIEILGVEEANINGQNMTVGAAIIDGHGSVFVDADRDGLFDIGAIDINDNQHFENDEIFDLRDERLSVDSFKDPAQHSDVTTYEAQNEGISDDAEDMQGNDINGDEVSDIYTYDV